MKRVAITNIVIFQLDFYCGTNEPQDDTIIFKSTIYNVSGESVKI